MDPDLRQYQREMALSAIAGRYTPKKLAPLTTKPIYRKKNSKPLFELDEDDTDAVAISKVIQEMEDEEDEELALAIQVSLDQSQSTLQPRASGSTPSKHKPPHESPRSAGFPNGRLPSPEVEIFAPSGLETFLSFAGTSSARGSTGRRVSGPQPQERSRRSFGAPSLLSNSNSPAPAPVSNGVEPAEMHSSTPQTVPTTTISGFEALTDSEDDEMEEVDVPTASIPTHETPESPIEIVPTKSTLALSQGDSEDDDDMEEVEITIPEQPNAREPSISLNVPSKPASIRVSSPSPEPEIQVPVSFPSPVPIPVESSSKQAINATPTISPPSTPDQREKTPLFAWSRSPSLSSSRPLEQGFGEPSTTFLASDDIISHEPVTQDKEKEANEEHEEEHWDAANEIDPHAEEGEFARFLSQMKGRNLNDVRKEIDDEIKVLNEQRKAAMRDSEDITQQMVSQIMVSPISVEFEGTVSWFSSDDAEAVWYTLYNSTNGSRSSMRRTRLPRPCRRSHHR